MSAKTIGKGEEGTYERVLGGKSVCWAESASAGLSNMSLNLISALQVMDIPWMYMITRSPTTSPPALSMTLPVVALLRGIYLVLLRLVSVNDVGDVKVAAAVDSAAAFLAVRLI